MPRSGILSENVDIGIVHDDYGCYLAKFLYPRERTLFFVLYYRVGTGDVQQACLESMVKR